MNFFGNAISSNLLHELKASFPILLTVIGIMIDVKLWHRSKVAFPIFSKPIGKRKRPT